MIALTWKIKNVACQRIKKPAHLWWSHASRPNIRHLGDVWITQSYLYTPVLLKNHSFNKSCHHILKNRNFLKIFFYHEDPSNGYRFLLIWIKSVYVEAFEIFIKQTIRFWCVLCEGQFCILKHLNLIYGKDFQLTKSYSATSLASGVTILLKVIFLLQFTRNYSLKVVIHCANE